MKTNCVRSLVLLAFAAAASCKKDEGTLPAAPSPSPTIYVGGSINSQAAYWKNGEQVTVPKATSITSIVVSGSDVYMAGPSNNAGVYWKNGNPIAIPNALEVDYLAISGTNVYSTGLDKSANLAYWTNDAEVNLNSTLPNVSYSYGTSGIATSGNDVYVIGSLFFVGSPYPADSTYVGNRAVYWKNGRLVYLSHGGYGGEYYPSTTGLGLSGPDVYAAGNVDIDADTTYWCGYWKNGAPVTLLNSTSRQYAVANSLALSGNDVIVAGSLVTNGVGEAVFWRNGQLNYLQSGKTANAMSIYNHDVYILGVDQIGDNVVWKNGTVIQRLGHVGAVCIAIQ